MSETLTIELHNKAQAWAAIKAQVFPFLAQVLQSGNRWVLTITRRKRTSKQNRRYWGNGVLKQIAEQAAPGGKLYSAEIWHEQFKRKFIGVIELPDGSVQGESSTGKKRQVLQSIIRPSGKQHRRSDIREHIQKNNFA